MLGGQTNDTRGSVREGDLPLDGRPATQRRALQVKEQENAAKEAFDGTALAQFGFGPGGRQAGAILLTFRIPGDDGGGMESLMDPGNEAQAPVGGVQTDDARMDLIETNSPLQQRASERGIMDVGWGEQKEEREAGAATEQGMHAIAAEEWARMLSRGMADSSIGVGPSPGQDRRTIDNQIACANQSASHGGQHAQHKECFCDRGASDGRPLALLGGTGNAGVARATQRQAAREG